MDELALREGELHSFINTANVADNRWEVTAICEAIYKGRGAAWETLSCKFVEMKKEVNVRHPSGSSRAQTFWKVKDADQTLATKIQCREEVRQEPLGAHLSSLWENVTH